MFKNKIAKENQEKQYIQLIQDIVDHGTDEKGREDWDQTHCLLPQSFYHVWTHDD